MPNYQNQIEQYAEDLKKALQRLEWSYNKVKILPTNIEKLDLDQLETWESFAARFARASEIFLNRYLRAKVLEKDPGFEGYFRDFLNKGEKLGLINDTEKWVEIRALRNRSAHGYENEEISRYFIQIKMLYPLLIDLKNKLK